MKLLRVTGSYYPAKSMGGAVTADFEIDKNLVSKGNTLDVYTTTAGLSKQFNRTSEINGINIYYFPFIGPVNFSISYLFIYKLALCILFRKYDVIIFSGVWNLPNIVGMVLCRLMKTKYVVTLHGSLYPELIERRKSLLKKFLLRCCIRKNLIKASFIHVTVENEKIALHEVVKDRCNVKVIPLGFNFCGFPIVNANDVTVFKSKFNINDDSLIVLFLGRLNWKKGVDILAKSINKVRIETGLNIKLLCVGPEEDGYINLLHDKLLSESEFSNIIFTGYLSGNELYTSYRVANLFALTSHSENFAMTTLEAAHYEVPILISRFVGASCFFENEKSAMITTLDPYVITNSIKQVLLSDELQRLLIENAKLVSESLTLDKCTTDFENELKSL